MTLSEFLLSNKQQYLSAIHGGKGREWVVVMGNEAGDLDSVASSIAYSWFLATVNKLPSVALIQTPREDIKLRPENVHAFSLASLTPDHKELLYIDDIPSSVPFPSNRYALVDHNVLLPRFSEGNDDATVVAVLDHHSDEGLYKGTADPRTIVSSGSATSIVARHFQLSDPNGELQILPELATLLFCGALLDTSGLKPGGKAVALDYESAAYLFPRSHLASSGPFDVSESAASAASPWRSLSQELQERKSSVAHLSSTDLLRRDYKQYEWTPLWGADSERRSIHIGLSTVPLGLKSWLPRGVSEFWDSVDRFMDERNLDVLGILTTFHSEKKGKEGGHKSQTDAKKKHAEKKHETGEAKDEKVGKHKRQVLFVVRELPGGGLEERLWAGLEGSGELELKRRPIQKYTKDASTDGGIDNRKARAYKQHNTKATRKTVAPLLKQIIEGDSVETEKTD
ncbi:hypothetical protein M0805_004658 [Coniferiporia weirii]|nr:hypothetical protein M0805_004658 [Coniferiporia weirii]